MLDPCRPPEAVPSFVMIVVAITLVTLAAVPWVKATPVLAPLSPVATVRTMIHRYLMSVRRSLLLVRDVVSAGAAGRPPLLTPRPSLAALPPTLRIASIVALVTPSLTMLGIFPAPALAMLASARRSMRLLPGGG